MALVTGASSGIGAATARALAAEGAAVALLARRADRLDQLKADIESAGGTALAVPADVTDADQVAAAVQRTVDELGRLDTVVNNAGLMRMAPAAEAPLQDWDELVRVNIQGVLYVTRAAIPHLIDAAADSPRGVADIVTISSTAGWVARPGTAVYSLTKFGVNAFSEGIRQELIGKRVRVGVVGPGTVDTEISDHLPTGACGVRPPDRRHGQVGARGHRRRRAVRRHPRPPSRRQPHAGPRRRTDLVMSADRWVTGDHFGLSDTRRPCGVTCRWHSISHRRFRAYGALTPITPSRGSASSTMSRAAAPAARLFSRVEYDKPGAHTDLFVKFSRDFDDPIRDRGKTQMESEVLFASLSREPGFPITVPAAQFADYHRDTGTGILITERIQFGANGIERQYHKCLDYEMPEPLEHYRALVSALGRLAAAIGPAACRSSTTSPSTCRRRRLASGCRSAPTS